MITAVIDTNVLVSALLSRRDDAPPVRIYDAVMARTLHIAVSPTLIEEYLAVLSRPKLRRLHGLTGGQIDTIVAEFVLRASVVTPIDAGPTSPDPGDQMLFDLVAALPGCVLVTGDRRLLHIDGVTALTPAEMVGRLQRPRD